MTITFPQNPPPEPGFQQAQIAIRSVVPTSQNNFNFAQSNNNFGANKWTGSLTLPEMRQDQARDWKAWLVSLRGKQGTFKVSDPGYFGPRGAVRNQGTVTSVPQPDKGFYLSADGFQANTEIFKFGDQFEINGELKTVVQDIESGDTGSALLVFLPRLHDTNVVGKSIIYDQPQGTFQLDENLIQWEDQTVMSRIDFPITEAV